MHVDHEPVAAPGELPAEPTPLQAPRPSIPPELEQVITHLSAPYLAEVRALGEELRQRLPTTARATFEVLPSVLEPPPDPHAAQPATAWAGVPAPQRPIPPVAPTPAYHQRRIRLEWLGEKGWRLLWVVTVLVGIALGVLMGVMTS